MLLLGVAATASAAAPAPVTLPSPLVGLSPEPPLAGGATSSSETRAHRVEATTTVRVSVDGTGAAFAAAAVQRLVVRGRGDYVFTVGAPLTAVTRAPGSASEPGERGTAILWAGFNPGTRTLAARVALQPSVLGVLPLRIERRGDRVTLVDRTQAKATALAADARAAPLRTALRRLAADAAAGRVPQPVGAVLTSTPTSVLLRVAAPLDVTGTIGARPVRLRLGGGHPLAVTVRAGGSIDLTVSPVAVLRLPPSGASGRAVLAAANRTLLALARVRQYEAFLGNPDPGGRSTTTYRYVSSTRPRPVAVPAPGKHGGGLLHVLAWTAAAIVAAGLALVAWARS